MDEQDIIKRIQDKFPGAIIDITGEDCSFELYIISKEFNGLRSLQRQQSVLGIFSEELKTGKLHALGLSLKTPEEYEKTLNAGLVQLTL